MKNRFNLVSEPWIPIADVGKVSLKQVFTNYDYQSLGGTAVQKIALLKLLLAIAQAAYTPEDNEAWVNLSSKGMAKKCVNYLEVWYDAFWLYGENPFLQMPQLFNAEIKSFGAVLPEIATGNTTIINDTQIERVYDDAEKALILITLMGFGLGGKKTDNKIILTKDYKGKTNDKGKPSTGKPGTFIGYQGFLHNFLEGQTLLETLWFNLLSIEQLNEIKIYRKNVGVAPWEKMPLGEDCHLAQDLKQSLMGRLVPMSRFCLLTENGLHYSEGIAYPNYKEGGICPSMAVNSSGKDVRVIWTDPNKRPWRYLTAMLSFFSSNSQASFTCILVKFGLQRAATVAKKIGVWSGGLRVSSNAGEQYVSGNDDFVDSHILLDTNNLGEEWYNRLKTEMEQLEQLSRVIYSATNTYYKKQNMDGKAFAELAVNLFWQLCERYFIDLIESCYKGIKIRERFIQCLEKAYDTFCPKQTARQLDAWAYAKPRLYNY